MEEEIQNCIAVLKKGGTILYPTDTIWGIGCDATNEKAVNKIYKLKKRPETKSLIILLDDAKKLQNYIKKVPDIAWDLLDSVDTPITIIYPNAKNLPKNVVGEDHSIAIRVVKNEFCKRLISLFGKPIISSSANVSGDSSPKIFRHVSSEILNHVDYVVNLYQDVLTEVRASRIIKIEENGEFNIIRP